MSEILLLTGDVQQAHNDNAPRLAGAFHRAGWRVYCASHENLAVRANRLQIDQRSPEEFDLIWPLGFGKQATFFDRMQLLRPLPQQRFVTEVDALMYLHGKHRWLELMPETHTSTDPDALLSIIEAGGEWVLKPPGGSYGRDVHRVIDRADAERLLLNRPDSETGSYWMLQRFVPEIVLGEKRTLIAGGELIGTYLRLPSDGFKANVAADAHIQTAELTEAERLLVARLAVDLTALGVGYAAIDTLRGYLIEVNIANPGGLGSLESLYGHDFTDAAVQAILRWRGGLPGKVEGTIEEQTL